MTVPILPTTIDPAELELASRCIAHWRGDDLSTSLVSGQLGTFARGAIATQSASDGTIFTAANAMPRWEARDWSSTGSRTHMGLLMEGDRVNLCARSQEFDQWTAQSGCTVTANATTAPDRTVTADRIVSPGAIGSTGVHKTVAFTGNGVKAASVYLKRGDGNSGVVLTDVGIYSAEAVAFRHIVRVTWTGAVPTISTQGGAGTLFPIENVGNGWYRIAFSAAGVVAANTNLFYIYPTGGGFDAGSVFAWGAQAENATTPSSYIGTGSGTASRPGDSLSWAADWIPQAFGFWLEFIEHGARTNGGSLFSISRPSQNSPSVLLYGYEEVVGAPSYRLYVDNGINGMAVITTLQPQMGDRMVIRGQIYGESYLGAGDSSCQMWQSLNGGAEVATVRSYMPTGFLSSWGVDGRLRLNNWGAGGTGSTWFKRLKIVPGIPDRDTLARIL